MSAAKRRRSPENREPAADCYGPALPPYLIKNKDTNSTNKVSETCSPNKEPKLEIIGPVLPPHLSKQSSSDCREASDKNNIEKSSIVGPVLPPHLLQKQSEEIDDNDSSNAGTFGPSLPSNLKTSHTNSVESQRVIGPGLPPQMTQHNSDESDEDEEDFGPLPPEASRLSSAHIALEERALQMKLDKLEPNQQKAPEREEWMLELPEVKASKFGLGPRQFRSKEGPDMSDRSSWTKVAGESKTSEKEVKVDLQKEAELRELKRRDKEQEKMAKKHKKREKSLMESHQDKLKEKKKEEGPAERRPFSREIDLQVNRFDEAQKKAVLKKAELLDDRFSTGKSKYL